MIFPLRLIAPAVSAAFALMTVQVTPAFAQSAPARPETVTLPPLTFFIAKGAPDSCGIGCDTWIAAHGRVDDDAAKRFRKFLARAGKKNLPLFVHSSGGRGIQAIEIGRLLRQHKMRIGIARSVPLDCKDGEFAESCNALRRSGKELRAELKTNAACNSACVMILVGGEKREIGAEAKLWIHHYKYFDMKNGERVPITSKARLAATRKLGQQFEAMVNRYLRDMGIDTEYLKASLSIPFESPRELTREEIFRFGIDRREFGDSGWRYVGDRSRPYVVDVAFYRHGGDGQAQGNAFSTTAVLLSCFTDGRLQLSTDTQTSSAKFSSEDIALVFGSERIVLAPPATAPKPDARERRSAVMSAAAATQLWLSREVTLNVPGLAVKLDASGLKAALGSLREMCLPPDIAKT